MVVYFQIGWLIDWLMDLTCVCVCVFRAEFIFLSKCMQHTMKEENESNYLTTKLHMFVFPKKKTKKTRMRDIYIECSLLGGKKKIKTNCSKTPSKFPAQNNKLVHCFFGKFLHRTIGCLMFFRALIKETAHNWCLRFRLTHIHNSEFACNYAQLTQKNNNIKTYAHIERHTQKTKSSSTI